MILLNSLLSLQLNILHYVLIGVLVVILTVFTIITIEKVKKRRNEKSPNSQLSQEENSEGESDSTEQQQFESIINPLENLDATEKADLSCDLTNVAEDLESDTKNVESTFITELSQSEIGDVTYTDSENPLGGSFESEQVEEVLFDDEIPYNSEILQGEFLLSDSDTNSGQLFYYGNKLQVRYIKSFTAKLSQSSDTIIEWYKQIKQTLLSYQGVKCRLSFYAETFKKDKKVIAKIVITGKTLYLYLALNPQDYTDTKYVFKDVSSVKKYAQVPMSLRIKSERSTRWAKDLINKMCSDNGYLKDDSYKLICNIEHKSTKQLVLEREIKLIKQGD